MCQYYLFLAILCPGNGSNSQRGRWTCRRGGGGVFTSSTANLPLHPSHPWTLQPPAAPWLRGDLAPVTHPWASAPPWARIQKEAIARSNLLCCQRGFLFCPLCPQQDQGDRQQRGGEGHWRGEWQEVWNTESNGLINVVLCWDLLTTTQKVHLLLDLHEVGGRDAPINHLRGDDTKCRVLQFCYDAVMQWFEPSDNLFPEMTQRKRSRLGPGTSTKRGGKAFEVIAHELLKNCNTKTPLHSWQKIVESILLTSYSNLIMWV